ncbi:Spermine/spermidine acetyltransferase [Novipirellula aureliae]|uniref:Spermine/spermidine acetyltransferase n=1 Tax=Novipirellula aureliae TaxID=2527966 RepID=A0A5C6DGW8_9BACT|nr:GNAT family N-acetyltransferase [Novipirellula aureliae]TWU36533.1 Spermine/spermidine acetyltransferase [Novipirellula aureliae]
MNRSFEIVQLDCLNPHHADAILNLLSEYADDPAIGRPGINEEVKSRLIGEMAKRPSVVAMLAFTSDHLESTAAVGAVICIESFSTFSAKSVINIHDLMVAKNYRGKGVGRRLLAAVEEMARTRNCSKITLEVFETNAAAKILYHRFGFQSPEADKEMGQTLFLAKPIEKA